MDNNKRQELMSRAAYNMRPGSFQHAAGYYDELEEKELYKSSCLACAQDCFEMGMYALAINYFELGERKDLSDLLQYTCMKKGIKLSLDMETRPACMPSCPDKEDRMNDYLHRNQIINKKLESIEDLLQNVQKEGFINKAMKVVGK